MEIVGVLIAALLLDYLIGEPRRYHPLVGFGTLARKVESFAQQFAYRRLAGTLSWLLLILPFPLIYFLSSANSFFWLLSDAIVLYLAIGRKSLAEHAMNVAQPLQRGDLEKARLHCSYLVSRNTQQLDKTQISRAVTESVLENGHDAVIASLFWYLVGGAPLVILHRLANTLDAMWGYKNERYLHFGWFSARMDDLLGWPSAKASALLYALQGNSVHCLRNAYQQSKYYKSLNGGWAMASGATALGIKLGGTSEYFGKTIVSPVLGAGREVEPKDIERSVSLVNKATWLFVTLVTTTVAVVEYL